MRDKIEYFYRASSSSMKEYLTPEQIQEIAQRGKETMSGIGYDMGEYYCKIILFDKVENEPIYEDRKPYYKEDFEKEVERATLAASNGYGPSVINHYIVNNSDFWDAGVIVFEKLDYSFSTLLDIWEEREAILEEDDGTLTPQRQNIVNQVDTVSVQTHIKELRSIAHILSKLYEKHNLIHMDLHPGNIMFSITKNKWFIIDYGTMKEITKNDTVKNVEDWLKTSLRILRSRIRNVDQPKTIDMLHNLDQEFTKVVESIVKMKRIENEMNAVKLDFQ
tara:strand:+ start:152 stop:982 length:831 start_codon:yes stop_codon:yes gene_type:complete